MTRAAAGGDSTSGLRAPVATASLIRRLARLFRRRGRGDRRRSRQPLERIQRIIELEVLDPLFFQLIGLGAETRVRRVVRLEQLVFDLGLREQMAAKIGLTDDLAVLVVR